MKTDITTKMLLAIIALGLLLNAFNPWLRPIPVAASVQGPPFTEIVTAYLEILLVDAGNIRDTLSFDGAELVKIRSDLDRIQRGTCANGKICEGNDPRDH